MSETTPSNPPAVLAAESNELTSDLFGFLHINEELPPEWQTVSSVETQLSTLKQEIVPTNQPAELSVPPLSAEQRQQVFDQLRSLLDTLMSDRESHTREQVITFLYLIRQRLTQIGITQAEMPADILQQLEDIVKHFEKEEKRKGELLLELEESLSGKEQTIDTSAITIIEPSAITEITSRDGAHPDEDALEITQRAQGGQETRGKIDQKQLLSALLIITVSDQLFKTNHIDILFDDLGNDVGKKIMGRIGFSREISQQFDKAAVTYFIEKQPTGAVVEFLSSTLDPEELTNFLKAMEPRDTALLLADKIFGQYSSTSVRHDLTEMQTNSILARLSRDQYFQILRRFSPDAMEIFFTQLPDLEKKKLISGEVFGPHSNLQITAEQLQELTAQLPDDKKHLMQSA